MSEIRSQPQHAASGARLGTITTRIPARLDRLPWSRWHWMIVIGLGTVWVLDGLEVTIVGNISGHLAKPGSGIHITQAQATGPGATMYVAGAWAGAAFGASSAYLTVSEVFPMETRAPAISCFYAVGTLAGGVSGPLLFSSLVSTGKVADTVVAFSVGAALMIVAGITEMFLGVKAEQRSLEEIAVPLSVQIGEQA